MKIQVVGKQRKVGEYEGNKYDNTYLHCVTNEFLEDGFEGHSTQVIKVKTSQVPSNLTVGSVIDVQYNAFGKVLGLTVVAGKEG
jgi:hypothetical protein